MSTHEKPSESSGDDVNDDNPQELPDGSSSHPKRVRMKEAKASSTFFSYLLRTPNPKPSFRDFISLDGKQPTNVKTRQYLKEQVLEEIHGLSNFKKLMHTTKTFVKRIQKAFATSLFRPSRHRRNYSLYLFSPEGATRRTCRSIDNAQWFEAAVLFFIIVNAAFLALWDPVAFQWERECYRANAGNSSACEDTFGSEMNDFIDVSEYFFSAVFFVEVIVKVISRGLIRGKGAYLTNAWDIFDFCIVMFSGAVLLTPDASNTSVVRMLRVIRSLRIIPALRLIMRTVFKSLPLLFDVGCLLLFFFLLFAIMGVNLFSGRLRGRCVGDNSTVVNVTAELIDSRTCNMLDNDLGYECPTGMTCIDVGNAYAPFINFDNLPHGLLTVFQIISLEGWTDISYRAMDGVNDLSVVYFLMLVVIGSFFALNLTLVVIADAYDLCSSEVTPPNRAPQMKVVPDDNGGERAVVVDAPVAEGDTTQSEYLRVVSSQKNFCGSGCLTKLERASSDALFETAVTIAVKRGLHYRSQFRRWCMKLMDAKLFNTAVLVVIILNTLTLSLFYYGMSDSLEKVLESFNLVFTILFTIEMVIRIAGEGNRAYWTRLSTAFDGTIVVISVVEIIIRQALDISAGGGLSILRTFRLLRVFKLIRSWRSMRILLMSMISTMRSVGHFALVLGVFTFLFSILSMQLLGGKLHDSELMEVLNITIYESPRENFNDFPHSFFTTFQVICGEDWNWVMYYASDAVGSWMTVYFVVIVLLGQYLTLNLFIAIVVTSFDTKAHRLLEDTSATADAFTAPLKVDVKGSSSGRTKAAKGPFKTRLPAKLAAVANSNLKPDEPDRFRNSQVFCQSKDETAASDSAPMCKDRKTLGTSQRSLFLFATDHPVRKFCVSATESPVFNGVILACIVISSILLAFESPTTDPSSTKAHALDICNYTLTGIFILEMLMKLVALGGFLHSNSYFRHGWNILDFLVVLSGVVSFFFTGSSLHSFKVVRILRTLRPLRLIARAPGLRVILNTLLKSIPEIANVIGVLVFFLLILGIVSVQYFGGTLCSCSCFLEDTAIETCSLERNVSSTFSNLTWIDPTLYDSGEGTLYSIIDTSLTTRGECEQLHAMFPSALDWNCPLYSFDSVPAAMLTLFSTSTLEGFTTVAFSLVDAVGVDMQPVRDNNPWVLFFSIFYVTLMGVFLLNLFVGIILENYNRAKAEDLLYSEMTTEQSHWVAYQEHLQHLKLRKHPPPPSQPWRLPFHRIAVSATLERFITACIILNAIVISLQYYNDCTFQPCTDTVDEVINVANLVFASIYTIELVVKLIGLGFRNYWAVKWNRFDGIIVVISLIAIVSGLEAATGPIRVLRILRIFRVVRSAIAIRSLLNTLLRSLSSLGNVSLLILITFFLYAVIGMNFFSFLRGPYPRTDDTPFGPYANFDTFGSSMFILFRMVTGEGWTNIMYNIMYSACYCPNGLHVENSDSACPNTPWVAPNCGSRFATIYFVSFVLLSGYVILNLLIGVLLDNFTNQSGRGLILKDYHFDLLADAWCARDPTGSGSVKDNVLKDMVTSLPPPLGCGDSAAPSQIARAVLNVGLPLPSRHNSLSFWNASQGLTRRALRSSFSECHVLCKDVDVHRPFPLAWELVKYEVELPKTDPLRTDTELDEDSPQCSLYSPHSMAFDLRTEAEEGIEDRECTISDEFAAVLLQRRWRDVLIRRGSFPTMVDDQAIVPSAHPNASAVHNDTDPVESAE